MREASELKDRNETSRLHQYSQALRRQPIRRLQISEMPQQTAHLATLRLVFDYRQLSTVTIKNNLNIS